MGYILSVNTPGQVLYTRIMSHTPSSKRSLEEVIQSAYLSRALNFPLYDALHLGDRWFQSDVAFELSDGRVLVYEHDPGYWHDDDRIEKDCEKTQKLLRYGNTLVVRARIGATELPMAHPRLIQLVVPEKVKPASLLYEIARAVCDRLPEPHRSTFRTMEKVKRRDVEAYATEVFRDIHPDYDVKLQERREFLDQHGMQKVDASTIVGIPLSTLKENVETFQAIGITTKTIATFPPLFRSSPETLRAKYIVLKVEFGITANTIATHPQLLMRSPETLRANGIIFREEFGVSAKAISSYPRLLVSSVATLRANYIVLTGEFEITAKAIASYPRLLTSDMEKLRPKVAWFREAGFDWKRDPGLLTSNLSRMQESFAFLVNENVPRKVITKRHVQRLTEAQKRRKYTHAPYSTLDGTSRLRVLCRP